MMTSEMSSKYKVHRNYDADWMTAETPCRCSAPATPSTIFSADSTHSVHAMETLAAYNRSDSTDKHTLPTKYIVEIYNISIPPTSLISIKYDVQDHERDRDDRAGHNVGQLEEVGVQGVSNKTSYNKQTCRQ